MNIKVQLTTEGEELFFLITEYVFYGSYVSYFRYKLFMYVGSLKGVSNTSIPTIQVISEITYTVRIPVIGYLELTLCGNVLLIISSASRFMRYQSDLQLNNFIPIAASRSLFLF